ncbi:hypothetical protein MMC10_009109 [Thelotrema lepadinum]|nr:hypothetical protein [Thelotrema lepadinum]
MAEKDRCFIFFPVGIRVSSMIKSNAYLLSVFDFSAAFMSIGRLSICVQLATYISEDPFFFLTPYLYWDVAEAGFSILAVCLPAIFQLVKHVRSRGPGYLIGRKPLSVTSVSGSAESINRGLGRSEKFGQPGWDSLYEGFGFGSYVTVSGGTSAPARRGAPDPYALPLEGIAVTQDITIATTDSA